MLAVYSDNHEPAMLTLVRRGSSTTLRGVARKNVAMELEFSEVQTFVSDLQQARYFYHDVPGLPLRLESPGFLVFDLTGADFTVIPGAARKPRNKPYGVERATVLCLKTSDIDAAYSEMSGRGVEFLSEIQGTADGRFAPFEDPDGNLLELVQTGT
jgi:catechol 2,3-dioxygenase-like lactoylglutathione lyase family enzyme